MAFDAQAAKASGYSDAEIADYLAAESKFDVAGARAAGYADADIIAELSSSGKPQKPAKKTTDPSLYDKNDRLKSLALRGVREGFRQVGRTGKNVAEGILGLPFLAANAGGEIINKGLGAVGSDYRVPQLSVGAAVDPRGYLAPQNEVERYGDAIERGLSGAATGFSAGAGLIGSASPVTSGVGATLAARPGLQALSAGTGATSSQAAAESGAGVPTQIAAGLAGGILPGVIAPKSAPLPPLRPTVQDITRSEAAAAARANVAPGLAQAETGFSATPEVAVRGGGVNFGTVGPDLSAGLTGVQRRIAARGNALGFRQTPGQATGSRALQQLEAKLESQPMTSGPFNAIKENNARVVNRAAAQAIGESSDTVDDVVLSRAANRIGGVFEQVADEAPRTIEPRGFVNFLSGLQEETRGLVNGLSKNPLVEDLTNFATQGAATGRQLSSLTSKLGKAAYKNMSTPSGDRDLGIALYRVKDYVDDLIGQGLTPEAQRAFGTARQQYRNLMLLTQRLGVVNPSTGNVSGRALANILQQKDKRGYLYGDNQTPFYDAARFSQAFSPIVGDSGTATRMPLQGVTDFLARIPLNIATRAYTSSPAVNLAVRAQAGSNYLRRQTGAVTRSPQAQDIPPAGLLGLIAAEDKKKKR